MKKEELTALGIAEEAAAKVVELADAELTETVKEFDGVDVEKLRTDLEATNKKFSEDTAHV